MRVLLRGLLLRFAMTTDPTEPKSPCIIEQPLRVDKVHR
jgi:hypothetical protein